MMTSWDALQEFSPEDYYKLIENVECEANRQLQTQKSFVAKNIPQYILGQLGMTSENLQMELEAGGDTSQVR